VSRQIGYTGVVGKGVNMTMAPKKKKNVAYSNKLYRKNSQN